MARSRFSNATKRRRPLVARRLAIRLFVIYPLVILIVAACMVVFMQRGMLFPRHVIRAADLEPLTPAPFEQVWIETSQGQVEAWYLQAATMDGEERRPAVIFAHGNGEVIDFNQELALAWRRRGYHVLMPEYRGYGRSAGEPSQDRIVSDMLAFHDWLTGRPEVDGSRIVYHGRSLGGAVLAQLAAERPPAAMILQSTFTSVKAMARRMWVPGFLIRDPFETDKVLPQLDCPVLVMHGRQDSIVPFSHGQELAELSPRGDFWYFSGDHNTPPPEHAYWQRIESFLRDAGLPVRSPVSTDPPTDEATEGD